jgi:Lrp/AsnC family transcriptional regulator, leucine-responsive regulatory protein
VERPLKRRDFVRQAFETPEAQLDAIDRRIVAELQAAPRLRIAELARRIGLSGPAVADRLRRLEETSILSYRAEVSPRALGYTLCAIVRISPSGGGLRLIPGIAREVPNITECYRITGEDCFFMKVLPGFDRRPRTDPGPVHPARQDHDLDRSFGAGPCAPTARTGCRVRRLNRAADPHVTVRRDRGRAMLPAGHG